MIYKVWLLNIAYTNFYLPGLQLTIPFLALYTSHTGFVQSHKHTMLLFSSKACILLFLPCRPPFFFCLFHLLLSFLFFKALTNMVSINPQSALNRKSCSYQITNLLPKILVFLVFLTVIVFHGKKCNFISMISLSL